LAVGIDPAKSAHHFVAVRYPDEVLWSQRIANHPDAVRQADLQLQALAAEHTLPVVYGTEDAERHGGSVAQLLVAAGREVRTVNPLQVKRQKDFYGEDKTDAVDARAVAAILLRRRHKLPRVESGHSIRHALRALSRYYDMLRRQHRRAFQQLHQSLSAGYLDAYGEFFYHLDRPLSLAFFERFPLPHDLVGQTPKTLARLLLQISNRKMGAGDPNKLAREKADKILSLALPLAQQPVTASVRVAAFMSRQLCVDLRRLASQLDEVQRELEGLLERLGDPLREQVVGVGTVLAAIIHGEVLTITRFDKRSAFAKYNGTAPAEKQSGNRRYHVARKRCNRRLKRAMWLLGLTAMQQDPHARVYFDKCVGRGMKPTEAIKRVARRLSDIVYATLRDWEAAQGNGDTRQPLDPAADEPGEGARTVMPCRSFHRASPRPVLSVAQALTEKPDGGTLT
jgi:transposase